MHVLLLVDIGVPNELNKALKSSFLVHHMEDVLVVDIGEAIEQEHSCNQLQRRRFILLAGCQQKPRHQYIQTGEQNT